MTADPWPAATPAGTDLELAYAMAHCECVERLVARGDDPALRFELLPVPEILAEAADPATDAEARRILLPLLSLREHLVAAQRAVLACAARRGEPPLLLEASHHLGAALARLLVGVR